MFTTNQGRLPTLTIDPLATYTSSAAFDATAPKSHIVKKFWQRHVKDDSSTFDIELKLSLPSGSGQGGADDDVTVTWAATGTAAALEDTLWSSSTPSPLTIRQGNSSAIIQITLIDQEKWFFEKFLNITITAVDGAVLSAATNHCQVVIIPSTDPPLVDISTPGGSVAAETAQVVGVHLSYIPLAGEEPTIYWKAEGDLASAITGTASGSLVFAAGTQSRNFTVEHDGSMASGTSGTIVADYESDQVAYSDRLWDPDTQAWVTGAKPVHADENLWCHSTDTMGAGTEWWPLTTDWPRIPADPRNTLLGGVDQDDKSLPIGTAEPQNTTDSKATDPVTGTALSAFTPNANYTDAGALPYIRQSFDVVWGGGPDTGHITQAWSRSVYRIAHWTENEVLNRNIALHRVGMRVRTQDRNHGATFATDVTGLTPGVAKNGASVSVFPDSSGVKHWFWEQHSGHDDDTYGVFEDAFGVGYYYCHKIDSSFVYSDGIGAEVEGTDSVNPIQYPIAYDSATHGSTPVEMAQNKEGVLMHSVEFQQFTASTAPPAPTTHWPKAGIHWSPRGNAVLNTAAPGTHTITVA